MKTSLAAFALSMLTTAIVTPGVRKLAFRIGAVDHPGFRRVHARPVARLGGLGVLLGFFTALAVLPMTRSSVAALFMHEPRHVLGLLIGGGMVFVLGLLDDIRPLGAKKKLAVQVASGVVAYLCAYRLDAVTLPIIGPFHLGWFAPVATVFWFVAVINALNLIDGLDGLAAGIAFFACISNLIVSYLNESVLVMLLAGSLGGAILGFLLYNFNPASIFLGDSGSHFVGFVLAAMSLLGSVVKSSTAVAILVPILALGVPITDTLFAMTRRFLEKRSIFAADRGHIHHRLLDLGLSHRRAVLILYGVSLLLAGSAIAFAMGQGWELGGAIVVTTLVLIGIVRSSELFERVRRRSFPGAIDDPSAAPPVLRHTVRKTLRRIDGARSVDEVRSALSHFATDLGAPSPVLDRVPAGGPQGIPAPDVLEQVLGRTERPWVLRFTLPPTYAPDRPEVRTLFLLVGDTVEARLVELQSEPPSVDRSAHAG